MGKSDTTMRPLRVAVIGAGPAGVYASDILLRKLAEESDDSQIGTEASIDIFEKLPAPFGLVRYGVAPDHPAIKWIIGALEKTIANPQIHLFCNVNFGVNITLEDIRRFYDIIIFATGAINDNPLRIPGSQLPQVTGAAQFVAWYDGYPQASTPQLTASSVAVIGGGNVAMDISRMLIKNPEDLMNTDIPQEVLQKLQHNQLTDLHLFVRRGPAQAKFSVQELRELENLRGVRLMVSDNDFEQIDEATRQQLSNDKLARQMLDELEIIRKMAQEMTENSRVAGYDVDKDGNEATRRYWFHFYSSPQEINERNNSVQSITVNHTHVTPDGKMTLTDQHTTYEVQAVYSAIGYQPAHVADIPYDDEHLTLQNNEGRTELQNVYVTGWAKRGPVGLIGSTKSDALETITHVIEDCKKDPQKGRSASEPTEEDIQNFLHNKGIQYTDFDGWKKLDAYERSRTDVPGRSHIKVTDADLMRRLSK